MQRLIISLLILLLTLPSIYLSSKNLDLNTLVLSIIPIIYIWALVKDSKYLIMFYPFVIFTPFIMFYIYYYNSSITEQILNIVIETNWQEASAYLGNNLYLYLALFLLWLIGVTLLFWHNQRLPLVWSHRSRWWVVSSISGIFSLILISNYWLNTRIDVSFLDTSPSFLSKPENIFTYEFKQTYPLGLFISFTKMFQEQIKINKAFARNQQFTFQAYSSRDASNKQLVVLVIGETSRRANWQLNDYKRETNPHLAVRANVINFSNMISISNATRSSIPMILTRKPEKDMNEYDFNEKSVISAFKEAGFQTYWISTQQKFGSHDTSTSVYAKEADDIIFLNKTDYTNQGDTDEIVLPVIDHILDTSEKKKFIIVHTLGSHFDYSHRYPPTFDIFKPSLNDLTDYSLQDRKYKQQLVNSYDNSILFTDYVLNSLIESLEEQQDTESFLVYSSDHGEDLFDNSCDKSGHGNETVYNFEIASFAWYSDRFAVNNSGKIQHLQSNRNRKINQTSIFPMLIDAADIVIPDDSRKRSLLDKFSPYSRLVMGGVDYDKSLPQGSCREIK